MAVFFSGAGSWTWASGCQAGMGLHPAVPPSCHAGVATRTPVLRWGWWDGDNLRRAGPASRECSQGSVSLSAETSVTLRASAQKRPCWRAGDQRAPGS